jgi:hypothetical protein
MMRLGSIVIVSLKTTKKTMEIAMSPVGTESWENGFLLSGKTSRRGNLMALGSECWRRLGSRGLSN